MLLGILAGGIDLLISSATGSNQLPPVFLIAFGIYYIMLIIPMLALSVRRLHDIGFSGWWYLISLVPYIGALILIVLFARPETPGPNKYGPDPKAQA